MYGNGEQNVSTTTECSMCLLSRKKTRRRETTKSWTENIFGKREFSNHDMTGDEVTSLFRLGEGEIGRREKLLMKDKNESTT